MPQLARKTRKLLRTVAGQMHATKIDHEEDPEREPESSSDELNHAETQTAKQIPKLPGNGISRTHPTRRKRKSEPSEEQLAMKRPKIEEPSWIADRLFPIANSHTRRATYGSTPTTEFKNLHTPDEKNSKPIRANGKKNGGFQPPPASSQISASAKEVTFKPPPELVHIPLSKTNGTPFKEPPAPERAALRRSTRSVAKMLTPEPSNPTFMFIPDAISVKSSSPPPEVVPEIEPTCPTCNLTVPEELISEWRARYPRMSIRIQQQFCREHTLLSAKTSWADQHPTHADVIDIHWNELDQRLQRYRNDMLWLIERPEKSYFRTQFERTIVDTGNSRNLLKHIIGRAPNGNKKKQQQDLSSDTSESSGISVGYYGTRGLKLMYVHAKSHACSVVLTNHTHQDGLHY
jgi:hypothetical protein